MNVLLASGVIVYALAFVLEAHILSTRCNKDYAMWLSERQLLPVMFATIQLIIQMYTQ